MNARSTASKIAKNGPQPTAEVRSQAAQDSAQRFLRSMAEARLDARLLLRSAR